MDNPSDLKDLFLKICQQLSRIAGALEILTQSGRPAAPNFTRPIEEYSAFDWSSIDAKVVRTDPDGATRVEWGGEAWTRRSPSNKFEPAVWYIRAAGRDDDGNVLYLRLITFKQMSDSDPLPANVYRELARPAASVSTEKAATQKKEEKASPSLPGSASTSPDKPKHGRLPDQVKEDVQRLAGQMATSGKTAGANQTGIVAAVLEGIFKDQEDQVGARRKVHTYLTGHDSLKNMPGHFILALYMWLKPYKDAGKEWRAGLFADEEAKVILAEVERNQ
jgi:hypothetical protein